MNAPTAVTSGDAVVAGGEVRLADDLVATIVHRGRAHALADLRARTGLLAISVRNPRFSNRVVAAFARLCRDHLAGGVVTVVDRPYERNLAAAGRGAAWEAAERAKLARIAGETRRRAERAVAFHGGPTVTVRAWDDLAAATPAWLDEAVRAAFARRGRFHADVLAQVRGAIPDVADDEAATRYAGFVLEELPVLLHAYYGGPTDVVDVYPGPQPPVFWRIEAGAYADEWPAGPRRLDVRAGLAYLEVREHPAG